MLSDRIQEEQLSFMQRLIPPYLDDPYALYHRLRAEDPVYWDEQMNAWVVTGYQEVLTALRHPLVSSNPTAIEQAGEAVEQEKQQRDQMILRAVDSQMIVLDPPRHTRLRHLLKQDLNARHAAALRPIIEQVVDHLLDELAKRGEIDVLHDFAFPVLAKILAHLFGLREQDIEQFIRWERDLGILLEASIYSQEEINQAWASMIECSDYLQQIVRQRRACPREDALQTLVRGREEGAVVDEEELLGNCFLVLASGYLITPHLICNGLLTLFRHPQQMELWRQGASLTPTAVEEIIRYDPVVHATHRIARGEMILGTKTIQAGEMLWVCLGAANHDPARFPDPDQLDLSRPNNLHLTFGYGIHHCLGAPLARLALEVIFTKLLRRFPAMKLLSPSPTHHSSLLFYTLSELPVALL